MIVHDRTDRHFKASSTNHSVNLNFKFVIHFFFELYAFIFFKKKLTSTLVLGINYFVIITRPLHPIPLCV